MELKFQRNSDSQIQVGGLSFLGPCRSALLGGVGSHRAVRPLALGGRSDAYIVPAAQRDPL